MTARYDKARGKALASIYHTGSLGDNIATPPPSTGRCICMAFGGGTFQAPESPQLNALNCETNKSALRSRCEDGAGIIQ
jgi:hypothetical protein